MKQEMIGWYVVVASSGWHTNHLHRAGHITTSAPHHSIFRPQTFRPHRSEMRPIVTDRVAWSDRLSHQWALQKRLNPLRYRLGLGLRWAQGTVYWNPDRPMGRGNFWGKGAYRDTAVTCAKMAEPFAIPFGLWARVGPSNHVLDGGPQVLRDVAMATNFWLLIGYNIGCMIASDMQFDSRCGFLWSCYPMKTQLRSSV